MARSKQTINQLSTPLPCPLGGVPKPTATAVSSISARNEAVAVEQLVVLQKQKEIEEKKCEVCHQQTPEETMLLCDACDKGYHTDCVHQTMPPENLKWFCPGTCSTVMVVKARPGNLSKGPRAIHDTVDVFRTIDTTIDLSSEQSRLLQEMDSRVKSLKRLFPEGHSLTDHGMSMSAILFPIRGGVHHTYISLAYATGKKSNPRLYSGSARQTERVITMITDNHDMSESMYATIGALRGSRTLVIVPEKHPDEHLLLRHLDIERIPVNAAGDTQRVLIRMKIFGKGKSYSASRCFVSKPAFRLWFQSCPDILAQLSTFFPPKDPVAPDTPDQVAPTEHQVPVMESVQVPPATEEMQVDDGQEGDDLRLCFREDDQSKWTEIKKRYNQKQKVFKWVSHKMAINRACLKKKTEDISKWTALRQQLVQRLDKADAMLLTLGQSKSKMESEIMHLDMDMRVATKERNDAWMEFLTVLQ